MTPRGAGCLGKPLVRFCEGQESPGVWTRYCGTAAKAGGKRRRRTSSCSSGRLLPTRSEAYRARDTKLDRREPMKTLALALAIAVSTVDVGIAQQPTFFSSPITLNSLIMSGPITGG